MKLWASVRIFVLTLSRRSDVERDMGEELRAHIQNRVEDLERSGLPRPEAERRARIEFGGNERFKEECREAMGTHFFDALLQDLKVGVRMLRRVPGFTAVAVLTLALGIAVNATMFSMVSAFLMRRPPGHDPERVVVVTSINAVPVFQADVTPVSVPNYLAWRA